MMKTFADMLWERAPGNIEGQAGKSAGLNGVVRAGVVFPKGHEAFLIGPHGGARKTGAFFLAPPVIFRCVNSSAGPFS